MGYCPCVGIGHALTLQQEVAPGVQMQVVRTITGAQFAEAFDEMLKPKLT